MLAKILGGKVGEKLAGPESTLVGLFSPGYSPAQILLPKTNPPTVDIYSLSPWGKIPPCGCCFLQASKSRPDWHLSFKRKDTCLLTPQSPQYKLCSDFISTKTRHYQPHSGGLHQQPEPPSQRHTPLEALRPPFQGTGVGSLLTTL